MRLMLISVPHDQCCGSSMVRVVDLVAALHDVDASAVGGRSCHHMELHDVVPGRDIANVDSLGMIAEDAWACRLECALSHKLVGPDLA